MTSEELAERVAEALWYHTIELRDGVVTPGELDLRPAMERIRFPRDLTGKRCLDIGMRDGFWAFEMEKRNAAEVVGVDLDDYNDFDWPQPFPPLIRDDYIGFDRRALTFPLAAAALGSQVKRINCSVYDLAPEKVGMFDFAFLGTLLLHLRDPVRALMAVRSVLRDGELLLNEPYSVPLALLRRRKPAAALLRFPAPYWSLANPAGHANRLEQAGYEIVDGGKPYFVRYGVSRAPARGPTTGFDPGDSGVSFIDRVVQRRGIPHVWFRARPV